ncbi:MAG: hypothetical protein GVY33_14785 [Alphaproteobacteria bacterium]|jgi:hypothetical protein|nr:hypothetical protein [Alphaproteobacteria bacterium]
MGGELVNTNDAPVAVAERRRRRLARPGVPLRTALAPIAVSVASHRAGVDRRAGFEADRGDDAARAAVDETPRVAGDAAIGEAAVAALAARRDDP